MGLSCRFVASLQSGVTGSKPVEYGRVCRGCGAVSDAFSDFLSDQAASANLIGSIDMVIQYLTEKGVMDPDWLYESSFSDIAPSGPEQVFDIARAKTFVGVINGLNESAAG
jgi:type I restriction enzyme R subunit